MRVARIRKVLRNIHAVDIEISEARVDCRNPAVDRDIAGLLTCGEPDGEKNCDDKFFQERLYWIENGVGEKQRMKMRIVSQPTIFRRVSRGVESMTGG